MTCMCLTFVFLANTMLSGISHAQSAGTPLPITPPAAPSFFVDEKGEQWIRIPEEGNADRLVKFSEADEKDVYAALKHFDYKSIPGQSLKQFGPEYIKFSAALMIVQMGSCFGGNSSLSSMSMVASAATPACVDDFLAHLVDWKGWVGFYFFMLGNRYTSTALMQVATISLHHVGKTKSIPELRRKLAPYFGYFGMAGGSLASQVVHHFLAAPSWGQCIELMSEEGPASAPCKNAFKHFLQGEDFWDDFAAGTMSMIMSSAAAAVTHKLLGEGSSLLIKNLPLLAKKGLQIIGGDRKAIELVGRTGVQAIRAIRVVKNLTVATGVPGVVVFVVTNLGQFVLFLAWDEVFKNPVARAYYDWETSSNTRAATLDVIAAAKENQKLNWQTPYIITKKICRPQRYSAVDKKTEKHCTSESTDPLTSSLAEFAYGAKRYRKKVLQNPAEAAIAGWSGKMSGLVSKYKLSKTLIEFLSKEKSKELEYSMTLPEAGVYLLALWKNVLENELPRHPKVPKNLKPILVQLEAALAISYAAIPVVNSPSTPAHTNYFTAELQETAAKIPMNPNREAAIKSAINLIMQYAAERIESDTATSAALGTECSYLPQLCLARDTTLALDLNKSFSTVPSSNTNELSESYFKIFGDELAAEATWELLCAGNTKLQLKNLGQNGKKAAMTLPQLLSLSRADFDANCYDHSTLRDKGHVELGDVTRPWIYEGRIYKNALDMLASKNTVWTVGNTGQDIQAWWMREAFHPVAKFLFEMSKVYQNHLNETLFSQIDDVTPEQLVHMASPQMRGGSLDYKIVSFNGKWDRPTLAVSLMAQANMIIDTVKFYGPARGVDLRKFDELKLAYARYILGLKVVPNINSMEKVWQSYSSEAQGTDSNSVRNAQLKFDEDLQETILSKEQSVTILKNLEAIYSLTAEIFTQMNSREYSDVSGLEKAVLRLRASEPIEDAAEYVSLKPVEQKLFATFILHSESLNNITFEIKELYGKLGAKPFTGM